MESFIGLCLLLGVGHLLRMKVKLLQKLYLPSCVIAGLLGVIVIQCVLATGVPVPDVASKDWQPGTPLSTAKKLDPWKPGEPYPNTWSAEGPDKTEWPLATRALVTWTASVKKLPGLLINVVFACLFLGVAIPGLRTVWKHAGPQLAYGQVVAWGQYVVGVGLVLVLLGPLFGLAPMFGGIVPVGFEGGHGTAGGMVPVFDKLGWKDGGDFALASATAGIISAVVVGMILVNWAVRKGYTVRRQDPESIPEDESIGVIPVDQRPSAGKLTISPGAMESLALHLAIVGVAIGFGWVMKQGLLALAVSIGNPMFTTVAKSFPLFPLCMIGGILVQLWSQKLDRWKLIDPGLMKRIQNISLDFLVVAAIMTINVRALVPALVPFAIIVGAAILWNVFCVVFLARRMLPDAWFERSIAEMGQSMGVTATGLLLLRVVDPEYKSPAADAFAYKQIMHEPFMGGGLWTSMAIPLLATWTIYGALGWPVLLVACGAVAFWLFLVFVLRIFRNHGAAA